MSLSTISAPPSEHAIENSRMISFDNVRTFGTFLLRNRNVTTTLYQRVWRIYSNAVESSLLRDDGLLYVRIWLDESDLMDSPPLNVDRNVRVVTIAASFRVDVGSERANSTPHAP